MGKDKRSKPATELTDRMIRGSGRAKKKNKKPNVQSQKTGTKE